MSRKLLDSYKVKERIIKIVLLAQVHSVTTIMCQARKMLPVKWLVDRQGIVKEGWGITGENLGRVVKSLVNVYKSRPGRDLLRVTSGRGLEIEEKISPSFEQ